MSCGYLRRGLALARAASWALPRGRQLRLHSLVLARGAREDCIYAVDWNDCNDRAFGWLACGAGGRELLQRRAAKALMKRLKRVFFLLFRNQVPVAYP
jgi:hypothetical protein